MLTLYHAPQSRSSRIVWLLEEIGEPYDIKYLDIRRADGSGVEDANNPHPSKKVPALDHDGTLVTESAAICLYLSDAFPKAGLGPLTGEPGRADYLTWLFYYQGGIEPSMVAKATDWASPPGITGWDRFEVMEQRIADRLEQGTWMLGEQFSTVDILIGSLLQWAGRMFPARPVYDRLRDQVAARPALARAMAKDAAPQ